jgi:hypothetical protein
VSRLRQGNERRDMERARIRGETVENGLAKRACSRRDRIIRLRAMSAFLTSPNHGRWTGQQITRSVESALYAVDIIFRHRTEPLIHDSPCVILEGLVSRLSV